MKVSINYTEITNWVSNHYRIALTFKRISPNTFEASYNPGVFIPTVHITIKIENFQENFICMSYDCSMPISMLIAGAIGHLQERIPEGIEIKPDEKRIRIYLEKIDKLQPALEKVSLSNLSLNEECAELTLELK
ncbi:MAG: hypothetical protein K2I11_06595 [Bacteroides sp.]|nr:hypothetical protein [Bacteroides sp.]